MKQEREIGPLMSRAYRETSVAFPWQRGDALLLDNFLTSHGREPFSGPRRIVVAMAELYTAPAA
ncbi:MAG TPA: TauD/TfdA family dioxygenase [Thermoanaerobaculia bacterium]|nr:TauD/TfdA family dioxygenase [Thermoanaerobaculia bacterium]